MTPKHKEVYDRYLKGEKFTDIAKTLGVSRARVQQIYKAEISYKTAVTNNPYILTLRASGGGGKCAAGWLRKFMVEKKMTTTDIVAKGAYWLREQPGVGEGKISKLAWALEVHKLIPSADKWLSGDTCLK